MLEEYKESLNNGLDDIEDEEPQELRRELQQLFHAVGG
jgi:hypothetical protein